MGRVVPHDRLMAEARDAGRPACQAAPLAARAAKEMAVRSREMGWTEAVRFGETMRLVASSTEDAQEGRAAFRERRAPELAGPLSRQFPAQRQAKRGCSSPSTRSQTPSRATRRNW